MIAEERAKNHHLLANDLERILNGRPRQAPAAEALFRHEIPRDKEQGLPLLRVLEPVRRLEEMVLEDTAREHEKYSLAVIWRDTENADAMLYAQIRQQLTARARQRARAKR